MTEQTLQGIFPVRLVAAYATTDETGRETGADVGVLEVYSTEATLEAVWPELFERVAREGHVLVSDDPTANGGATWELVANRNF